MEHKKKKREIKFLFIGLGLLLAGLLARFLNTEIYIIYDYLFIAAIYFIAVYIIMPQNKWGIRLFIFLVLAGAGVYILWPMIKTGFMFLTGRKLPGYGYSAFKFIPARLHALLIAIWSSGLAVCLINKTPIRKLAVGMFAVLHILVFTAFDINIKEVTYNIDLPNMAGGNAITIAHISDLHSSIYADEQQYLINKLKAGEADLILMTGDIADNYTDFKGTELLLSGIKDIAPIYYVTGNHEYWDRNFFEINERIRNFGVTHLADSYETINVKGSEIMLAGIDDPHKSMQYNDYAGFENSLEYLDNAAANLSGAKILLSHRPEKAELYNNTDFDIILTGHAHGGQVRIPFLINGLYAPNQGFLPQYAGGNYELSDNKYMIVSRGLYIDSLPRVFNPPELVWIKIE